jgi:outer membrane biosynthesis protein TonB
MKLRHLILIFICVHLCSSVDQISAQTSPPDPRFGIIESYESPAAATAAGAAWTRVVFHWATTQADGPDSWAPAVSDEQINREMEAGRLVVGMLIGIPDWARDDNRLPNGLALPYDDPDNTWANYVRQAVEQYAGRIDHWIIWNEPDIWDENAPGHTWDGTEEEFAQLQRVAYLTAKEANPDATIHLAAMTWFWDAQFDREQYLGRLLDVITADPEAAEHNYYFDALTAHLYFQPALVYDVIQEFHAIVAAHGIPRKPIWLVETNAPPIDDDTWRVPNWTLSVIQNEQAAFIPQAFALALAAGAERIAIYKLKDTETDRAANPEPFGLVRLDGSYRPAYNTFQAATQYLAGANWAVRERWDEVGQVLVNQGDHTTTVIFARLPAEQQAQVPATADSALLVNMWGDVQTITPAGGRFFINLPAAPCTQSIGDYCMIGGMVYYVVQAADPNAPTVTPTPTETARPTHTPIPTATAEPTNTATMEATMPPTETAPPSPTPVQPEPAAHTPTAASTQPPAATPTATAATGQTGSSNLSYWFIGAGLVGSIALAASLYFNNRRS